MDDIEYKFQRDSIEIDDGINGKDINDGSQSSLVSQNGQTSENSFLYDNALNIKTETLEHSEEELDSIKYKLENQSAEEFLSDCSEQEEFLTITYDVGWEKDDANVELVVPAYDKPKIVEIKNSLNRCSEYNTPKEVGRKYLLYDKLVATIVDYDLDDKPIIEFSAPNDLDDKNLPIQCGICPKIMSKSKIAAHLNTHLLSSINRYQCIYCIANFKSSNNLSHHVRRHIGIRPYVCDKCKFSFPTELGLKVHYGRRHQGKHYFCKVCGKAFTGRFQLKRHCEFVHEKIRPYKCNTCPESFTYKLGLERHMAIHMGKPSNKVCKICGVISRNRNEMSKHRRQHHLSNTKHQQQKQQDDKEETDIDLLIPLQNVEHDIDKIKSTAPIASPEDKGPMNVFTKYKLCDDLVATVVDYDAEGAPIVKFSMESNTEADEDLPIECGICPVIMDRLKIDAHRDTHLAPDSNRYKCIYCDKTFESCKYLAFHVRRHLGIRPYACDKCELYFAIKQELRAHNKKRHWKKDHNCKVCGKTFAEKYELKNHQEDAHEKKRRFECDSCCKSYLRNFALLEHIRVAHMGKPRNKTCKICGVICSGRSEMSKHRRQYHLHQTHFECNICNEKFTDMSYFYAHKRSIQCRNNTKRKHEQEENKIVCT